ncbi:molybdopterin synthase [Halorubellus sp. PRR65]|uniref:molybdopterin synthase n=1 Tax=Halorubellus sp. PRR65 TaxID=3098148 RepID=UPI002B25FFAC|nr:molybdopterin synthase [Halorubellus sp. PRR65]
MHVVSVVGNSDAGKTTVVEALADRLDDRGSVGTIKHLTHDPDVDTDGKDTARHRAAGARETYGVVDGGDWFGTGVDLTLDDALDRLASRHDYAVVEGFSDSALPKVAVGDRDVAAPVLARAPTPSALDYDAVLDAIDALEPRHTLESLVADVTSSPHADRAGAIATFTGRVRARDESDDPETTHLEFEKYDGVAEDRMTAIREDLQARDGVLAVRMHHRTGVVEAGEDIVFVVVLAGHRREAFRTVEDGIDRLKDEVPLFKKEVTVDDEFWRHDRPDA